MTDYKEKYQEAKKTISEQKKVIKKQENFIEKRCLILAEKNKKALFHDKQSLKPQTVHLALVRVGEKETGLAFRSEPCEHFENYISDGLEAELVTYGQHEDLVLVVLLNVVSLTSLFNGRLLDDIGQTASVASLEAQAILKLIGDAQGD